MQRKDYKPTKWNWSGAPRAPSSAFGTFNTNVPQETQQVPAITRRFEGGRNSARGRTFENLGVNGVGSANLQGTFLRA